MKTEKINTKAESTVKGYSQDYKSIKSEVESKWPQWKVSTYNTNFATSAHAIKLETK